MYDLYLPKALLYGCSYELFWKLNPKKLEAFAKAYEEKIELLNTCMDTAAWLNGMYVLNAIGAAFGKHSNKYPEKPNTQRDFALEERMRIRKFFDSHSEYMREKREKKKKAEAVKQEVNDNG